ncbi:MAG: NfeD family protein [Clostridia bacterium]|nr:NfeD family protein [Clostridia bacterium]
MGMYGWAIVWAVVFIAALWAEAETCEMVAMWFLPGAVASLVLALCNLDWWIQIVVFIALSTLFLVLAKTVFKKYLVKKVGQEKTDTDLLIGRSARVVDDIDNFEERGAVKINGQIWTARMENDSEKAAEGESVVIVEIKGVKLICKRT